MAIHTFFCGVRGVIGPLIALIIYDRFNAQVVANISILGILVTTFLMLPLAPVMRRREQEMRTT